MTLHTINAGGFSAVADAFALDGDEGLWFLSMVGSQNALKAIWAALLKQPPDAAWLIEGTEDALHGDYRRCVIPYETIGTWTTRITRLPACGGYHAVVFTRLAEYGFERDQFLLLAPTEDEAPFLHYRFLDRRLPLPLYPGWARWLWERGLRTGEVQPLESQGILAYRCRLAATDLRQDIGDAVAAGDLLVPRDEHLNGNGHHKRDLESTTITMKGEDIWHSWPHRPRRASIPRRRRWSGGWPTSSS